MVATLIWGMGFVGTRWTLLDYSPIWSNTLRFVFAGAISLPVILFWRPNKMLKGPLICSALLAVALQLQTYGIGLTTLAKSGFLTVFYAIFTPLLTLVFYKIRFRKSYWALLSLAMFGIALLCEFQLENFNMGDIITLSSAFFFALHILAVDKFAEGENPIRFNSLQCVYMGILCLAFALTVEEFPSMAPLLEWQNLFRISSLNGFIVLSAFSSFIAFSLQVYSQQGTPPHIVSLVFLLESIFAAVFGYYFFAEELSYMALFGCGLVLLSVALIPRFTKYEKKHPLKEVEVTF